MLFLLSKCNQLKNEWRVQQNQPQQTKHEKKKMKRNGVEWTSSHEAGLFILFTRISRDYTQAKHYSAAHCLGRALYFGLLFEKAATAVCYRAYGWMERMFIWNARIQNLYDCILSISLFLTLCCRFLFSIWSLKQLPAQTHTQRHTYCMNNGLLHTFHVLFEIALKSVWGKRINV